MRIENLSISDFRVLQHLELKPAARLNLIWGDNGAGKTSILEAVFLAARGRSFRHQEAGPFIRTGSAHSRVVLHLEDDSGRHHVLGLERGRREQQVRLDGQPLQRRSDQVRALPLQLLTPNSHTLIEGPPELRRRYLDMGLFHVEHGYHHSYTEYQRALRQRNAALRSQPRMATSWDRSLETLAARLHASRLGYVTRLATAAAQVLSRIAPGLSVELGYRPGWDTETGLANQLAQRLETDTRLGFTGVGPHRADIQIRAEHSEAAKRLSRGQQKIVLLALVLGQVAVHRELAIGVPVLLLDDLPAELDRAHRERVVAELRDQSVQTLITSVDHDSLPVGSDWGVFHVEQGGRLVP